MKPIVIDRVPSTALEALSERSRACVERLSMHEVERIDLSGRPSSRLAAVLVLLYERAGDVRVLLTTRSKALRTHAGQTALPGGKFDDADSDLVQTAYREAFEEVALPVHCPDIHTVCILEPFLSLHRLLVTPVVALLSNPAIIDNLRASEGEVAKIFNHPLEALLDPRLARAEPLVNLGSEYWPYDTELHSTTDSPVPILGGSIYRMHRFRSTASPIKGLTSDILIKTAEIAYGKCTTYERYAPDQIHGFAAIYRLAEEHDPSKITSSLGA